MRKSRVGTTQINNNKIIKQIFYFFVSYHLQIVITIILDVTKKGVVRGLHDDND